ncbi:MAG: FMN-binding glutamate synthase family protein, partial [Pseudoxanthomonas sp.]|nr:FMN-binding glutamate synthase family protein [Pseudoxanthomonas sp.]
SLSCHTDRCPTGIATQNPNRWKHLEPLDKATRVHNFHDNTLRALRDLLCAAGLAHPSELGPEHILRRVSPVEIRSLAALYRYLRPGELLQGIPEHAVFHDFWAEARSDAFQPPARVEALRRSKC